MSIEGYLFYISLIGIILLVSYKTYMVRRYEKANKSYICLDTFSKTHLVVFKSVYTTIVFVKNKMFYPSCKHVAYNCVLVHRGAMRLVNDIRYGTKKYEKVMKKRGSASAYMQKILDQKKKIQNKAEKKHP